MLDAERLETSGAYDHAAALLAHRHGPIEAGPGARGEVPGIGELVQMPLLGRPLRRSAERR